MTTIKVFSSVFVYISKIKENEQETHNSSIYFLISRIPIVNLSINNCHPFACLSHPLISAIHRILPHTNVNRTLQFLYPHVFFKPQPLIFIVIDRYILLSTVGMKSNSWPQLGLSQLMVTSAAIHCIRPLQLIMIINGKLISQSSLSQFWQRTLPVYSIHRIL